MQYGAKCWAVKTADARRIQTTKIKMIKTIFDKALLDEIANSVLRKWIDVEDMDKQLKTHRLE